MVRDVRVPIADVGASSNHACAMCPTVETGETRSLLLGRHSSDGTTAMGHLPVGIEGYGPLLQRCIVVVPPTLSCTAGGVLLAIVSMLAAIQAKLCEVSDRVWCF
jgi:hypothetical protein